MGASKVKEDEERHYIQVDVLGAYLSKIKCAGSSELTFQKLFDVVKSVLVIPQSDATEKQVLSMVHKNKTPFRPHLALDGTLSSLLLNLELKSLVKNLNSIQTSLKVLRKSHESPFI